jgi:hypothetical protein
MVVHSCHPSNSGKAKIGESQARLALQKVIPYLQNNQSKKGWRNGSVVENLPTKHVSLEFKQTNEKDGAKKFAHEIMQNQLLHYWNKFTCRKALFALLILKSVGKLFCILYIKL